MKTSRESKKHEESETHKPWHKNAKPRKRHARSSSLILGRDGKEYYVSINGNGMVGVQEVVHGRVKRVDTERLRYADEIIKWMEESAKAADQVPFIPPQIQQAAQLPEPRTQP